MKYKVREKVECSKKSSCNSDSVKVTFHPKMCFVLLADVR